MNERLDLAIARLKDLPNGDQDRLAEAILELIGNLDVSSALSADQVAEIGLRRRAVRDSLDGLASDDEMNDLWAHCGL